MKIISSQHFIDWEIVERKMEQLEGHEFVEIPCYEIGEIEGEEMAIQADAHHTMAAARELGIETRFVFSKEPEGLTGESALEAHWNDGDWYDVEKSNPTYEEYNFVW